MVVRARAPGKVILSGEHAVVHGSTAVAAAIDLYTNVLVENHTSESDRDLLTLQIEDMDIDFSWSIKKIKDTLCDSITPDPLSKKTLSANVLKLIALFVDDVNFPDVKIGLSSGITAFLWLYISILGYRPAAVVIKSELPLGSGLGSSASLCVSLSGALLASSGVLKANANHCGWIPLENSDFELINRWAFDGEKIIHGKPSGIDNTVSTYGKLITYKSGKLDRISCRLPLRMLITNTKVERNTKALVAKVFERAANYQAVLGAVFSAVDSISTELSHIIKSTISDDLSIIEKEKKIQKLMEMNQGLLQCMGVSHASIETVVQTTMKYNLMSKLTGAGGGGCVLTFLPTVLSRAVLNEVIKELEQYGFQCIEATIGGEGLQICFDAQL